MGQITIDQSHQVIATLAVNTDWATIDFANSGLQDFIVRNPKEAGRQFTAFLKNGGKIIVGESKIIPINHGRFNPNSLIGQIDQSHQVIATLAVNTDWATIDFANSGLQDFIVRNPKEAGRQFTAFLKNGGKIIVGESKIIPINHGRFNPNSLLIGQGWNIWVDETDTRSIALTELDLTKVQHVTMLKDGETYVNGEEKLRRLKESDYIRLDADIFLTLWENQHLIPESWKERVNWNTRYIFFDGTVLRDSVGGRYVLCLFWSRGRWRWNVSWLMGNWDIRQPSAVLAI